MSTTILNDVRSKGKGYTLYEGSFAPDTANAPTTVRGTGWTVARESAGLFKITFAEKYPEMIKATVSLQLATKDDKFLQLGTYDATAGTLQIRVWDVSGADVADVAANANNRINFSVTFRNTTVTK
jgi:hypothetical protein